MTLNEKSAYLKGLYDGLNMKKDSDESKLFAAIIDTIGEMAGAIHNLETENDAMNDELDVLEETLEELEEDLDEIDEELDEIAEILEDCLFDEDDDDEDWDDEDWDDDLYELTCPTCGEEIVINEDMLEAGSLVCPNCKEDLEFDLSSLDECECGCGGHHHGHHHHEEGAESEEEKKEDGDVLKF